MKRIKKAVIFLLVAVMVLSSTAVAFAEDGRDKWEKKWEDKNEKKHKFSDWQNVPQWADEALTRMYMKGVIRGDSGAAAPNREITNAEAATMVLRILGLEEQAKIDIDAKLEIEDEDEVPGWARGTVARALKEGLMEKQNGRFKPGHHLTRVEAAILLVRAAKLEAEARAQMDAILPFKDARAIPARAVGYVAVAYDRGFLVGFPDGTFRPNQKITRAEWAALLDRIDRKTDQFKDNRQVKGTVAEVVYGSAPTITVITPVFPQGYPYQVDDTAVFYVDGKEATILDVHKGDQVIFQLSETRKILMVTVMRKAQNVLGDYRGTVTQVVAGTSTALPSISLITDQGATLTANIADWAIVLGPSGPTTLADVKAGARAEIRVQAELATRIKLLAR